MAARRPIRVCEGVAVLTSTNSSNHTCATEAVLGESLKTRRIVSARKKQKKTPTRKEREREMADLSKFVVNNVKICFDFCFL